MTHQSKQIIVFLILAIGSYGLWKYFFDREEVIKDQPFTKGYSVENFELDITDENGVFSASFHSPNLTRYTDNDVVLIDSPEFWTFENNKKNWLFKSKKAEYDYKKEQVNLINDVIVKNLDLEDAIQLDAKDLLVDLDTKIANTSNGILLRKELIKLEGQKAIFDLNTSKLTVNNNVQVVYKNSN